MRLFFHLFFNLLCTWLHHLLSLSLSPYNTHTHTQRGLSHASMHKTTNDKTNGLQHPQQKQACSACGCASVYSRLQYVCVLPLRCSVLSVGKVVGQHGVHKLMHLFLLSAAEQLRIHLIHTTDAQLHRMNVLPPH